MLNSFIASVPPTVGAIDVTGATGAAADLAIAVGVVGAATVTAYVATKAFPFVRQWIGKLYAASTGRAGG